MRVGSLCSGYGGLDLAVPSVEPVDVLTAGYPCQPFSQAGNRKGTDDPRHLWPAHQERPHQGSAAPDAYGDGLGRLAVYGPAVDRWSATLGRPAPAPVERHRGRPRLAPRFAEWMMARRSRPARARRMSGLGPPYAPYLPDRIRQQLEVVDTPGVPGDFCWQWRGPLNNRGYGRVSWRGRTTVVHRVVWAAYGRALPTRPMVLDHTCRNRACANPAHLEAVTNGENLRRGDAGFGRGVCRAGLHDVTTPGAVYVRGTGERLCRACLNAYKRARYAERGRG